MRFVDVTLLDPPGPRVTQRRNGCAPTAGAIGAWASTGADPHILANHLQIVMQTWRRSGVRAREVAEHLCNVGITTHWFENAPFRRVIELQLTGALSIGIDSSVVYGGRPSGHAVVVSRVLIPEFPEWWRAFAPAEEWADLFAIEIMDPDSSAPARTKVPYRTLKAAFERSGSQGIYTPGLILA